MPIKNDIDDMRKKLISTLGLKTNEDLLNWSDVGNSKKYSLEEMTKIFGWKGTTVCKRCPCGQPIVHCHYIRHKITKQEVIVGSECQKYFNGGAVIFTECVACETSFKPHGKILYCKPCRKLKKKYDGNTILRKYQTKKVRFGKHYGKSYDYMLEKELGYIKWLKKLPNKFPHAVYLLMELRKYVQIMKFNSLK